MIACPSFCRGRNEPPGLGEREADADELRWMILRPYPAALMRAYPVGTRVGNVRNNDAGLLDEISIAA